MGLLGNGWGDPQSSANMALAAGLLRGDVGAGLLGSDVAYQRTRQNQSMEQMHQLQMQNMQAQMEDQRRQREQQAKLDEAARGSFVSPAKANAMSMGPMPNGSAMPQVQPGFDPQQYLQALYQVDPQKAVAFQQSIAKDNSPLTVAPGASLVDRHTMKPLFTAPKEQAPTDIARLFSEMQSLPPNDPRRVDYANAIKKATTHQPATTVNVDSLGLKPKDRFEMEDKLRNDYTKATASDQDIVSTHADIKNILQQQGSLKDQAAIYKFAKALDPQGAVREADYAAIVKTAGGLEYITNLVNKAMTGEQLSPGQRKQMADVTEAMARVAQQRISRQQSTYASRAKMYNLKPENVYAAPSAGGDEWAIVPSGAR